LVFLSFAPVLGALLETGTDNKVPSLLCGDSLGFITVILKQIKEPILIHNHSFQNFEKVKQPPKNPLFLYWFFHESHQFIKGFQITRNDGLLILILENQN
jgi:hypothetical protein